MNPTLSTYEPPVSTHPMPSRAWHQTTQLAPGVRGFTFEKEGILFIPLIVAEKEGNGDVGRFLDRLSMRCLIMEVTSDRLRGMLERRGYVKIEIEQHNFWSRR